jgi:hypothetical protein
MASVACARKLVDGQLQVLELRVPHRSVRATWHLSRTMTYGEFVLFQPGEKIEEDEINATY